MNATQMSELESLVGALHGEPTGECHTCANCGDGVIVRDGDDWTDGDWCFRCWQNWGERAAAILPTLFHLVRELGENDTAALRRELAFQTARREEFERRYNDQCSGVWTAASRLKSTQEALRNITLLCRRIVSISMGTPTDKWRLPRVHELAAHGVRIGAENGVTFSPLRDAERTFPTQEESDREHAQED